MIPVVLEAGQISTEVRQMVQLGSMLKAVVQVVQT
jgi:hypothetical protein